MRCGSLLLVVAVSMLGPFVPGEPAGGELLEALREAAYARPDDRAAVDAYFVALEPDDDGLVVVEGDLLLSRVELSDYLRSEMAEEGERTARPSGELIVDRLGRSDNYHADPKSRRLTYSILSQTFSEEERREVAEKLALAAEGWQKVCPECGISFVEVTLEHAPYFLVRKRGNGRYLASAFFPDAPEARRYLNIDPSFFTTALTKTGILRHELGHILGYRHEHIRGIRGCKSEKGVWRPLTQYDAKSVMHYFCSGGGDIGLRISENDEKGHRALYGPTARPIAKTQAAARFATRWEAALEAPEDPARRAALAAELPRTKDANFYVVEGDLLIAAAELEDYLRSRRPSGPRPATPPGELLVNRIGDRDDVHPRSRRRLRYRVDAATFRAKDKYQDIVRAMERAADDWNDACDDCDIRFEHAAEYDQTEPPGDAVFFTVREQDEGGAFLAVAFFPHDPESRRFLTIDPSFYSADFDRQGMLRHELGHILGYRHEHIRGVPGCVQEDTLWRAVTPYDPKSVMHYFCGDAGSLKLDLSKSDRDGHRVTYRDRTDDGAPLQGRISISFEGGDIPNNITAVFSLLRKHDLLPTMTIRLAAGENVDVVLKRELNLPGVPNSLRKLAGQMNGYKNWRKMHPGDTLELPDVRLERKDVLYAFDLTVPEERHRYSLILDEWSDWTGKPDEISTLPGLPTPDFVRVPLAQYRLDVAVQTPEDAERVRRVIEAVEDASLKHTRAMWLPSSTGRRERSQFHSTPKPMGASDGRDFFDIHLAKPEFARGEQGDLGKLVGVRRSQVVRRCSPFCPQVVLVDQQVLPHPELRETVMGLEGVPADPLKGELQRFEIDRVAATDHATHLAGIIGAGDNGFGLIGVDPDARIINLTWPDNGDYDKTLESWVEMADRVNDEISSLGAAVLFVSASNFKYKPDMKDPKDRFEQPLAKRIQESKPLWITAAGQDKENLTRQSPIGPMNLGDLSNVVVVSGCLGCDATTREMQAPPHLMHEANSSKGDRLVHIAAPSEDVPSTISGGKYGTDGGTSQAAAFVGGVASLMMRTYPRTFSASRNVKARLLTTSRPILDPDCIENVTAGVVDAHAALLDPTKHWIRMVDGENCCDGLEDCGTDNCDTASYCELRDLRWLDENMALGTTLRPKTQPVAEIRRIFRSDATGEKLMLYTTPIDDPTEITRLGPILARKPAQALLAGIIVEPGAELTERLIPPEKIADLILALSARTPRRLRR